LDESVLAIRDFDHQRLEQTLKEAAGFLGVQGVLQRVLAPLAERVGDLWRKGEITAAHEHFGTNIIRRFLDEISSPFPSSESGPVLVVATPAGQLHEMGALMAGALAANLGWRVTHLGASLPAVEIAGAARQKKARAVAMSLIYPGDDPSVADEIRMLRSSLPSECAIIAGGRAMEGYREVLETTGALMVENLPGLGIVLDRLRQGGRGAGPRK
jgi:methanogenic corrinoid protein MtbC1